MGRGGQRPPPQQLHQLRPVVKPREDLRQHYTVLDEKAYDLRLLAERHPGGALALQYAAGRDLTRTWAGLHAFADPRTTRAWLTRSRVRDAQLEKAIVAAATPDVYDEGDTVTEALDRSEREAAAFEKSGGASEPPAELLDGADLGAALATSVRWHFRRAQRASGQRTLAAATKAPAAWWAWAALVALAFAAAYVAWVRGSLAGLVLLGPLGQLLAFACMHDASHCAVSTTRWVNVALAYAGVAYTSPHEWTLQHVLAHHVAPNVPGEDPDVAHADRYRKPLTGFKLVDAGLVWLVALPAAITLLAPLRVARDGVYPGASFGVPSKSNALHFAGRAAHAYAFFLWPFFSKAYSCQAAAAWVSVPAFLGSVVFMAVTQIAHLLEATIDGPRGRRAWADQQMACACDFAPSSTVVHLLTGGLNRQVEHHLFPTVHHFHLPALGEIVDRVSEAFRAPRHVAPSMRAALAAHLRFLRGLEDVEEGGAAVYAGTVAHARAPVAGEPAHRFATGHRMYLLPLDDAAAMAPYASGPLAWKAADHLRSLPGDRKTPEDVADAVRALCIERTKGLMPRVDTPRSVVDEPERRARPGAVELLTMPRCLGYVFNPISVYYVRDDAGEPAFVVFEVANTPWLEETLYVHPWRPSDSYSDAKKMHVSPFQPMGQRYDWRAPFPGDEVELRVDVSRGADRYFAATFDGTKTRAPASTLGRLAAGLRLTPHAAVFLIHAHAALLLAKGAKFYPHPSGVKTAFSRTVEVCFHARYWALLLWAATKVHPVLTAVAALGLLQKAASVLSRSGSSSAEKGLATTGGAAPSGKSGGDAWTDVGTGEDASSTSASSRGRVAVVGSGVAGNGAAYLLTKAGYDVVVYESSDRAGGHAWTVDVGGAAVDVGFQVFNTANYPRLTTLFDELGVEHVESDMSLSLAGAGGECWSSKNPFAGCMFRPLRFLARVRLLLEVLRFEKFAKRAARGIDVKGNESTRAWLERHGFSRRLADEYVGPMVGAIWSKCDGDVLDEFPVASVAVFLDNHFMLHRTRPKWRTPRRRSRDYVAKVVDAVGRSNYRLSAEVSALSKVGGKWQVTAPGTSEKPFDRVVLACPAPRAAALLPEADEDVARAKALLAPLTTTPNDVAVHRDASFMPSDKNAWAAWNCRPGGVLTYWANALQPGVSDEDLFITLNAPADAFSTAPLWRRTMAHPVLDAAAAAAREALPALQGRGGVYFAGAWCGYGFHEDGLESAHAAVAALTGAEDPRPARAFTATPKLAKLALQLVCRGTRAAAARTANVEKPRPEIVMTLPGGEDLVAAEAVSSKERVAIVVKDPAAAFQLLSDPAMGLAETYVAGTVALEPSIRAVLHAALRCKGSGQAASPQTVGGWSPLTLATRLTDVVAHARNANTRAGSAANIAAHYDLSNAFYSLFLDATLTYSSALFESSHEPYLRREGLLTDGGDRGDSSDDASDAVLAAAQTAKLDALIDKAGVRDGDRVLEIGCGWGSLALRCCERFPNAKYVAITISKEQLKEARDRVATRPDLADRVEVAFCDYRDAAAKFGGFDRVLSCEMIEAVGHEFLPGYFRAIYDCLKGGGGAALQIITVPDERYPSYIKGSDFIRKHVFPGSSLVCVKAVEDALPRLGSLSLHLAKGAISSLGLSYARTLHAWRRRFDAREAEVDALGFDEVFRRKWRYYLDYCEAGFAARHIDVLQIRLEKTDESLAVEATEGAHGGAPASLTDMGIKAVKGVATAAFERGLLPDAVTRYGIRRLSAQQLRHCDDAGRAAGGEAGVAGAQEKLRETLAALAAAPVAVCTREANEQHYEVDARFYGLCLGPHRKYSACVYEGAESVWPGNELQSRAAELLPKAEKDSLDQVAARGDISQATRSILDVGCGWGSASLYMADRFRNARVVGVSNSHSQRAYIMGQARTRGLTNLEIVTLDLSKDPLDKALAALRTASDCEFFERACSIEMFEHMKNYDALFAKISAVLAPAGRLFVHVFCHKQYAYHFVAKSDADWMAKYFFAGGTMPSADLFLHFAAKKGSPVALVDHWRNSGVHYALTAEGWLQNMDANAAEVRKVLAEAYPPGETELWFHRWRAFYLACVELFGYDGGQEWCIGHYLFEKR